ncbi:MAG: hypothetical protein R2724_17470 [Bryobacterales bacterium]
MSRLFALLVFTALLASAQQQTTSGKTRPNDNTNAQGTELGVKPEAVLKIEKVKGIVRNVDLKTRTVTIDPDGKGDALQLTFAQPSGREQIKTSKKAMKALGKKKLLLEEVKVGAKVELRYYTALGQMMELIVDHQS